MKSILMAAAMVAALSGVAQAATYDVSMTGAALDFTAQIVTDGSDMVTGITGMVNGIDAITGIVALLDPTYTPLWFWNNIFGASAPWVDNSGIVFTTASGLAFNIFTDGNGTVESFAPSTDANYNPGTYGTLEVSEVPVPAAGVLLLSAFGAVAALRRRKAKTV
jgi:hypothetical protein